MNTLYTHWLRLRMWALERDILQIEWRQQVLRCDLIDLKERKHALEIEIFNGENA